MKLYGKTMREGRHWKIVFGVAFTILGLSEGHLSPCRAQMIYKGGVISDRRNREAEAAPSAPQATAPSQSIYFPDNDFYYPSFFVTEGADRLLLSPTSMRLARVSPAAFPWNGAGFEGYDDPLRLPQDTLLSAPKRYDVETVSLTPKARAVRPDSALLVAHLPEHAVLWVEGTRTLSTGQTRYFQSPPLPPGRNFGYTVRTAWIESGKWVSQTRLVPVQAGTTQGLYLRRLPASHVKMKPERLPQ